METDEFIQRKIIENFGNSTIITIAHRLTTIANYDKILFLEKGKAVEYDEPYRLLVKNIGDRKITKKNGHFADMVLHAGDRIAT